MKCVEFTEAELLSPGGGEVGVCDCRQVKVHFRLGVVCEGDEEARTVVRETSTAAGARRGLERVKDGEH